MRLRPKRDWGSRDTTVVIVAVLVVGPLLGYFTHMKEWPQPLLAGLAVAVIAVILIGGDVQSRAAGRSNPERSTAEQSDER
jgi:hypothetical protein